jgi:hypothetical protein
LLGIKSKKVRCVRSRDNLAIGQVHRPPEIAIIAGWRISEMPPGAQNRAVASARGLGDDGSASCYMLPWLISGRINLLHVLQLAVACMFVVASAACADECNFKSLFNGHDLNGWQGVTSDASASWKVEDGDIVCTGQKGTWLRSDEQYGDFNLRFEYRLRPGGNSGIYLRVPADGAHREGGGVEVQLLDDRAKRYKSIDPDQFCGSVYKVAPAIRHVSRPAGEWNTMEINCQGAAYRITHNGVLVVDATEAEFPELGKRFKKGYLGLQNHSEEVWFRNLRIGPPQAAPAEPSVAQSDGGEQLVRWRARARRAARRGR